MDCVARRSESMREGAWLRIGYFCVDMATTTDEDRSQCEVGRDVEVGSATLRPAEVDQFLYKSAPLQDCPPGNHRICGHATQVIIALTSYRKVEAFRGTAMKKKLDVHSDDWGISFGARSHKIYLQISSHSVHAYVIFTQ